MRNVIGRFNADGSVSGVVMADGGGHIYVSPGDGRGTVYRTVDGIQFEEFWRTGEPRVSAMAFFANALFVGTEPEGKILMHNFSTGNRFHFVSTGDYGVGGFAVLGTELFAGTFPSGEVLKFDGQDWTVEYVSFYSVSSLVAYNGSVYVFHSDAPFIVHGKGRGAWEFLKDGGEVFSVAKVMRVKTSQPGLSIQPNPERGVSCAAVLGQDIFFAGSSSSNLYMYDGKEFSMAHQFSGVRLAGVTVSGSQLFVASGDEVFVHEQMVQSSSGAASS